jgi:putative transposase
VSRVRDLSGHRLQDQRYKTCGLDGLNDRSRRPYRHANKLSYQVVACLHQLVQVPS